MAKKILSCLHFIFLCLLLLSCNDPKEFRVNDEMLLYVSRFETEAAKRGRYFDLKNSGLIIEFADLEEHLAGRCYFEKPIRIQIDREYWNKMKQYAGANYVLEELIFHEMGHGILNRKHYNALLENDEWKSIMCGGDSIYEKTWNINYRGKRRAYYLDELFSQNTPPPEFVSTYFPPDTSGFITAAHDDFSRNDLSRWKLSSNSYSLNVENGALQFESFSNAGAIVVTNIPSVNVQSDFYLELTLQFSGENDKARFGLAFGSTRKSPSESMDYFIINNHREMFVGNNAWYSYFTKIKQPNIVPKGKNKLGLLKKGEMLYFYINDAYAYCSEIETKESGNFFGFMAPPMEKLTLSDFRLASVDEATRAPARHETASEMAREVTIIPSEIHELRR